VNKGKVGRDSDFLWCRPKW